MPPEHDAHAQVHEFISAVSRRRWLLHLALSVALASTAALIVTAVASFTGAGDTVARMRVLLAALIGAVAMGLSSRIRSRHASAAAIEQAVPSSRNLVVTAEELERYPDRTSEVMRRRVFAAAGHTLSEIRTGQVVSTAWILAALVVGLVTGALATPLGQRTIREAAAAVTRALPTLGDPPTVRVRIEPPAYSGRAARTLDAPSRIEVLEGSRITFELRGPARVRFGDAPVTGAFVARASGYFAVERGGEGDADRERIVLIPLSVTRDRAPTVRIDAPAKDLLLPRGDRTIPVTMHATDDLGLADLELRFTKVSGTGEQFEFEEGTLPVRLERTSAREWRAAGELALGALRLGPGDSLVYRAVARDRRAGAAGTAASDTYFVEIAGPGQIALEGVDMPPELERYAMSQQMIVLKIERLRAKAPGMARESLAEEAAGIAAEQRTVRANFVFLLGGHVEDEEEEAEQSHEIQEGRLENTARKDINAAIGHMTRAAEGLTAANLAAALPPARAAVESLQRAFGRSRYLLRALAVRSRLDPSRRLTGNLADAASWQRARPEADEREGDAARRLLERLVDTGAAFNAGHAPDSRVLGRLAESALAIDSASPVWQDVAQRLLEARDARAIQAIVDTVAPEARRGGLSRTPLAEPLSPLSRAVRMERRP